MRSNDFSLEEKLEFWSPISKKQTVGIQDVLLHEVVGRYLWIVLEMYPQGNEEMSISNITIYLPSRSWIEYLPAIYQKADLEEGFLERYLGIFKLCMRI